MYKYLAKAEDRRSLSNMLHIFFKKYLNKKKYVFKIIFFGIQNLK